MSMGRRLNECGDAAHWRGRLDEGALAPLVATPAESGARAAVWGVAQDGDPGGAAVRRRRRHRRRGALQRLVLIADPARAPRELIGRGSDGREVARADLSSLESTFCTRPEGCG